MLFLKWSFDYIYMYVAYHVLYIINPWFVFKHTRTTMIWLRHSLDMTFIHFSYAMFFCFFCIMGLWVLLKYNTTHWKNIYVIWCFHIQTTLFSCLPFWLFYIKQPCFIVFTNLTVLYQAALFSRVYKSDCFISSSLVFSCLQIWLIDIKYPCFSCLQLFHIKQRIVRVYRYYSYISSIHVSRVNKSDFISNIIVSHVTLCFSSFQIWLF